MRPLFEGALPPRVPECERDGALTEGPVGLEGVRVVIAGRGAPPVRGVTVPARGLDEVVLATDGRAGWVVGTRVAMPGRPVDRPVEEVAVTGVRPGTRVAVVGRFEGRRVEEVTPVALTVRPAAAT